jgi:hypothetical protein
MALAAFAPVSQVATRFRAILVEHNADIDGNLDVAGTSTLHDDLDMSGQPIVNIGASGTDFGTNGSLTTAAGVTVSSGGLTVTAGGATISDGGLTLSDDDLVVADDLRITAQTGLTVTDSTAFTPTGTYQPIAAAGAVTPTIATGGASAGDVVTLINTSNQSVLIQDTGNQVLAGDLTLGQYDVLILWFDGTRWVEISRSNN